MAFFTKYDFYAKKLFFDGPEIWYVVIAMICFILIFNVLEILKIGKKFDFIPFAYSNFSKFIKNK